MMHGSMRRVNCLFGKRAEACEMIRHVVNTLIKNVVCALPGHNVRVGLILFERRVGVVGKLCIAL